MCVTGAICQPCPAYHAFLQSASSSPPKRADVNKVRPLCLSATRKGSYPVSRASSPRVLSLPFCIPVASPHKQQANQALRLRVALRVPQLRPCHPFPILRSTTTTCCTQSSSPLVTLHSFSALFCPIDITYDPPSFVSFTRRSLKHDR